MNDAFRFAEPWWLAALAILPALWWAMRRRAAAPPATLRFPDLAVFRAARAPDARLARATLAGARLLAIALAIVALARPQYGRVERQAVNEGIDMALVFDVSDSMGQQDLVPNRLEAGKAVLTEFVRSRRGDRLAYVIFGREAATLVPLTLDYGVVESFIARTRFGLVPGNGTAIGMGLATALAKLKDSEAKSRVVVLLTDGVSNVGRIEPLSAAEAARASGVRVYTIGVGAEALEIDSATGRVARDGVDEKTLRRMSEMTDGRFYRATDNEALAKVYGEIDKLEKSKVESTEFDNFNDLAAWLLAPAALLLLLETLARALRYTRIP